MKLTLVKRAILLLHEDGRPPYPFSHYLNKFTNPNTIDLIGQALRIFSAHEIEPVVRAMEMSVLRRSNSSQACTTGLSPKLNRSQIERSCRSPVPSEALLEVGNDPYWAKRHMTSTPTSSGLQAQACSWSARAQMEVPLRLDG